MTMLNVMQRSNEVNISDPKLAHATWYWSDNEHDAFLETLLPARNTHGDVHIEARIAMYETFGTWEVKENGRIVAEGTVKRSNNRWIGRSPQLRAEDIITRGVS